MDQKNVQKTVRGASKKEKKGWFYKMLMETSQREVQTPSTTFINILFERIIIIIIVVIIVIITIT